MNDGHEEQQETEGILNELRRILWDLHGNNPEEVTLESDLFADLGIDGQDAFQVIEAIHKKWDVDFSEFLWDRHFGPEGCFNPFLMLLPSWWIWHEKRLPLKVKDLLQAIEARRWRYNISV